MRLRVWGGGVAFKAIHPSCMHNQSVCMFSFFLFASGWSHICRISDAFAGDPSLFPPALWSGDAEIAWCGVQGLPSRFYLSTSTAFPACVPGADICTEPDALLALKKTPALRRRAVFAALSALDVSSHTFPGGASSPCLAAVALLFLLRQGWEIKTGSDVRDNVLCLFGGRPGALGWSGNHRHIWCGNESISPIRGRRTALEISSLEVRPPAVRLRPVALEVVS